MVVGSALHRLLTWPKQVTISLKVVVGSVLYRFSKWPKDIEPASYCVKQYPKAV